MGVAFPIVSALLCVRQTWPRKAREESFMLGIKLLTDEISRLGWVSKVFWVIDAEDD